MIDRKIDALIAKHIFNLNPVFSSEGRTLSDGPADWDWIRFEGSTLMNEIPFYTDSAEEAFKIVEKLALKGIMVTIMNWQYCGDRYYTVKFRNSDLINKEWEEKAETLPHAICLAALKALDIK